MQGGANRHGHQKPHVNLRQKNGMKIDLVELFLPHREFTATLC